MNLFLKLGIMLTFPLLLIGVQFAYNQYTLITHTYTVDPISPDDYVFDSELYSSLFNHTKWANVDSFAVGVAIPLENLSGDLKRDEERFGEVVMTLLWDERLTTQFSRPPQKTLPKMGDGSVSETLAAQVVSVGAKDMSIAVVSRPRKNQLPMGFEHVMVSFDWENGMAVAMIRYVWHTKTLSPDSWRKKLARWSQVNGRRQWLLRMAGEVGKGGGGGGVKEEL
ncbi:hypothetical protein GGS20DRAFT_559200 [Poronia punctata]|nr:hypothetical protein GGS20DRAFT_559200 [Poronia punctata]